MALNMWWRNAPGERYWLEVTGRSDIGLNLKAPQTNEKGREFWSYSLVREVKPGDVVFHYDRNRNAIVGGSIATGDLWEDKIVWAARGTYAREAGIEPHLRNGWYAGLEAYRPLSESLELVRIREAQPAILAGLERLEQIAAGPTYFPFERGQSRPIRAIQGYLFKLPLFFVELFPSLRGVDPAEGGAVSERLDPSSTPELGLAYRAANEESSVAQRDPFEVDPSLVERGIRGHATTQNALAAHLRGCGLVPRSPKGAEPNYDLAWEDGDKLFVAEVKSITARNEEKQLRLGLGQVLRYRSLLARRGTTIPVLVAERRPSDHSWEVLCEELGVLLMWPDAIAEKYRRALGADANATAQRKESART